MKHYFISHKELYYNSAYFSDIWSFFDFKTTYKMVSLLKHNSKEKYLTYYITPSMDKTFDTFDDALQEIKRFMAAQGYKELPEKYKSLI